MAKKSSKPTGRQADDYVVGEKLWEGDYSAGIIVCKMQCPERSGRLWLLLRNDKSQYTIYSAIRFAICAPVVGRMIPEVIVQRMFMEAFQGVELPDEIADSVQDREPVPKKKSGK